MIDVIIADDHPLMRDALQACLEDEADIRVIAEVFNGRDAVQAATSSDVDVIILDLYLPDMDGIQVLKEILKVKPAAAVLIFTSSMDEERITQALESGAMGYLIKDSPPAEIVQAIREVGQGRSFLSATAAGKLATALRQRPSTREGERIELLTSREEDILALIRAGASNLDIAQSLHIGETTVRTHIAHILRKMGLKNRSQLLMALLQQKNR